MLDASTSEREGRGRTRDGRACCVLAAVIGFGVGETGWAFVFGVNEIREADIGFETRR